MKNQLLIHRPRLLLDLWPTMCFCFFSPSNKARSAIYQGKHWQLEIEGNSRGEVATITDQIALIGFWSFLVEAHKAYPNERPDRFTIIKSDLCQALGRGTSGADFYRLERSFDRLANTHFNFDNRDQHFLPHRSWFKFLQDFESDSDGFHFLIPDWFRATLRSEKSAFLTLNPASLRLAPFQRALYRVALRSIGKSDWVFSLSELQARMGNFQTRSKFIERILNAQKFGALLDFSASIEIGPNGYSVRLSAKEGSAPCFAH